MEIISALLPLLPPAAIPLIFVIVVYFVIHRQRENTGKKRDEFQTLTEYRLKLLETGQTDLKDSIRELQDAIINLQLSINTLITEFKNLEKK